MKNLLIILLFLISCTPTPRKEKEAEAEASKKSTLEISDYLLSITEVDNAVNVYMEDSLIFASGTIHSSPEVDYQLDLDQYVIKGNETLKIELWNGVEPYNDQIDPYWEVRFDLIVKGEIVDFVHEFGDDNGIGKVFEISYNLDEW